MTFAQSLLLWKGASGSIWRLLCCATIISCSIIGATAAAGTKESLLEAHEIALRSGESHRLELGGLGSAGYMWSYEVAGEPDAVAVTIEAAAPPAPPPGAPPRSFSAQNSLVITGLKPGHATVVLSLRRPFERNKPPLREMRVQVTVSNPSR